MSSYFRAARDPSFLGLRPGLEVAGGFGFCWNVRLLSARKKYPFSSNYFHQSFVRAKLSLNLSNWPTLGAWVAHSFFLCLPRGQRLGQPDLEIGPPLIQRAIEEIVDYIKPARFVWFHFIDIAVFENAGSERQLLCGVVDQQRAFHKLATVIAGENAFAPKLKMHALEAFAVNDALFRRISRTHSLPLVVRCLLGSG
jgi:hypothetical protein